MSSDVCLAATDDVYLNHYTDPEHHNVLRVGVVVQSCAVVFQRGHVLFTSLDTFAVGCTVEPQHVAKTRTAEIWRLDSGIAMGSTVT